jgi:hypothetical protein
VCAASILPRLAAANSSSCEREDRAAGDVIFLNNSRPFHHLLAFYQFYAHIIFFKKGAMHAALFFSKKQ